MVYALFAVVSNSGPGGDIHVAKAKDELKNEAPMKQPCGPFS
jgi:hypothetical protein